MEACTLTRARLTTALGLVSVVFVVAALHQAYTSGRLFRESRYIRLDVHDTPGYDGVAIAVQGPSANFPEWHAIIKPVAGADLFYLAYDDNGHNCSLYDPAITRYGAQHHSQTAATTCIYVPSTWTTGRNRLIREIVKQEDWRQRRYKYFFFLDYDTTYFTCSWCPGNGTSSASCCWRSMMRVLTLPSMQYASVAPTKLKAGENGTLDYYVLRRDCVDARAQAFHRDAVPVLLPYWDDYENKTWWASQQLLFQFTVNCFPPGSHIMISGFNMSGNQHSKYPKGLLNTTEMQQLFKVTVPELLHGVLLTSSNSTVRDLTQPSCQHGPAPNWQPFSLAPGSVAWQDSSLFQLCRSVLTPRWDAFVQLE